MGNLLVLPLISDECFCNENKLELQPDLPAEDSNPVKLLPPLQESFNKANDQKLTEAEVGEGNGTLLRPPQPHKIEECAGTLLLPHQLFKKVYDSELVEAQKQTEVQVEERTGILLLPHELFKKVNDSELVEAQKQTEVPVEELTGTLLLPHQLFKKANNCDLVETQAGKRLSGVLLPHEFFKHCRGLKSNHPRACSVQ